MNFCKLACGRQGEKSEIFYQKLPTEEKNNCPTNRLGEEPLAKNVSGTLPDTVLAKEQASTTRSDNLYYSKYITKKMFMNR